MTQPLKHDRYGRPITRYELPLPEPARQRSSSFMRSASKARGPGIEFFVFAMGLLRMGPLS